VVPGLLADAGGRIARLAVGDGLKSFLNTCAAIRGLAEGRDPRGTYATLAAPFPRGYKKSLYAYHVDRARFAPGEEAWEAVGRALWEAAERGFPRGVAPRWAPLEDDPAVLYLALEEAGGRRRASMYVRNSGTERRTGVVLRGPAEWEGSLRAAGEAALRAILLRMKDKDDPDARAEEALLRRLAGGEADPSALDAELARFDASARPERIRREALRGGLIAEEGGRLALTGLGRWLLERGR